MATALHTSVGSNYETTITNRFHTNHYPMDSHVYGYLHR